MLMKSLLALAVGGVAAWQIAARKQARLDRERKTSAPKPHAENTWENEGGALRGTGAQLGPAPEMP